MPERFSGNHEPYLAPHTDTGGPPDVPIYLRQAPPPQFRQLSEGEIRSRATRLAEQALDLQIPRAHHGAQDRVARSITGFFRPHAEECLSIADQYGSEPYMSFVADTNEFLGVAVGVVVCPEDRIPSIAMVDPRAQDILRRAGGKPETYRETQHGQPVLQDPDVEAAIITNMNERRSRRQPVELVELLGPHINSGNALEGCGALAAKIREDRRALDLAFAPDGGIRHYYETLGPAIEAFNNTLRMHRAHGTTVDFTHDAASHGVISGLRNAHPDFRDDLTLRENLERLAANRQIVMSELLVPRFYNPIKELALKIQERDSVVLDDIGSQAANAILFGTTAREIIEQELRKNPSHPFPWIPDAVRYDLNDDALKVLAYMMMRNAAVITLAGIRPNNHDDLKHRAMVTRIGPVGAAFNVQHRALAQNAHTGGLNSEDLRLLGVLSGVADATYKEQGVDRSKYAGVIMTTQRALDGSASPYQQNQVAMTNSNNAEMVRQTMPNAIAHGEWTVIPVQHKPGTKEMVSVER